MPIPWSRGRGLTVGIAALLVLTATAPAASALPGTVPPAPPTAAAGPTRVLTLITGDRVTVTGEDGAETVLSVTDPHGRSGGAHVMTVGSDTYVYPDAAVPYLGSGALDERLFNVTELLEDGYDDARADELPLIVTYTDTAARSLGARTPEGARRTRALSSIRGAAISAEHSRAADFWTSLTGTGDAAAGGSAARSATSGGRLAGGIAKVWLDGKVRATLSDTTAQIGAPDVWSGGNTGEGVGVAVLDTGVDAGHPDFAGRIAATASFVPDQDVTDRNGHGTHVASTVAGTGAASGGVEKGVAPGASLHIGKVLDNSGSGQDSWVLAGMEWAVRDQHAKIVSMSLGDSPTDGTDPLSEAVNRLSAETGALFVVAAGNSGPEAYTVGTPAAADAALTVGAVNGPGKGVDQLADFSSRGPRVGDNAVKPDLTAPGVGVLAARSRYAPEGEGAYQSLSGTSMATPHVAGAAALLAAEHPDWTGQRLKEALVGTTAGTQRFSPFDAGSGRVDVAAAVRSTLLASGDAFAQAHYPYTPGQTVRRDVTYTNSGPAPVALDLALSPAELPEGLFTLSEAQVTVPAHGTASVGVITHLDAAEDNGAYATRLVATGADGAVLARTPVGVNKEGRRATLALTAKDHHDKPLSGTVILKDVERNTVPKVYSVDASGRLDLRLSPSTYSVWMNSAVPGVDGTHTLGFAMFTAPEVVLDADRTVAFDADDLRKAAAVTPRATANQFLRIDQYRGNTGLFPFMDSYVAEYWRYDSLWVTPTPEVRTGSYTFATRWRQIQPPLTFSAGSQTFDDVTVQSRSPQLPEGTRAYRAVWAGDGSATEFRGAEVRDRVAVVRRSDTVAPTDQAAAAEKAGARQLLILNDGYGKFDPWADLPEAAPLPVASLGTDDSTRLLARFRGAGTTTLRVVSHPVPRYAYDLVRHHDGAVPRDPSYRPAPGELARVDDTFRDTSQGRAVEYRQDISLLGQPLGIVPTQVRAQGELTSWVTADDDVRWVSFASRPDLGQRGVARSYEPRSTTRETWFAPIQHPRLLSDNGTSGQGPFRAGDNISTSVMTAWGDSGGHAGVVWADGDTSRISLYQGGELLGEDVNERIVMVGGLSPGPKPYRLVLEGSRNLPDRPYSTRTRTVWDFTSATTDPTRLTPLPLVQLDYAVAVDLSGRAHRRTELIVTASHLEGAAGAGAIRTATVEVSYDDGATWHRTALRKSADGWTARLDAPGRARYASLRTTAKDTEGNGVGQTLIRAFGLR
ncbi:S8 family serine peptidase [Streptomyces anthocyanicus]|uniref:S8 family serine peptidase n=1 Tax=Streptomyces anthocyanicus TaxID=68174 RepID=UPI0038739DA7|nr:S8 family serine peptidase [Streptomyces anthocyanicus]